jgi:hypothetical protein
MSQKNRPDLKATLETGDIPTQTDFENLIDSFQNALEDSETKIFKSVHPISEFSGTAALSGEFDSGFLPQGYVPVGFMARTTSEILSGGAITLMEISLYDQGLAGPITSDIELNLNADPGEWRMTRTNDFTILRDDAPYNAFIRLTADDTLDTLTDGEIEVWIMGLKRPDDSDAVQIWP